MARYTGHNLHIPHVLNYSWTGWPAKGTLPPLPNILDLWRPDGLTVLSHTHQPDQIQITFEAPPEVSPVFVASRAKGRLQHALRQAGAPATFSRKVAIRSLGHNIAGVVEAYIRDQLEHVDLADPRYRALLEKNSIHDPAVDLAQPAETNSGRYWYNLHLVLVVAARFRIGGATFLGRLRERCLGMGRTYGCVISRAAVMPDHLHIALRGQPEKSPLELGLAFQNELAEVARLRLWDARFYVGTFSEYSLAALR